MDRHAAALADRTFDVAIVGGGIFGAGVAREAALAGFSACLVERDDLASGTSSRSSKLIHGGIRYLERFEFGLVRQSLRERAILRRMAPHLVRPLPFLVPATRGRRMAPWKLRAGLCLYDFLAQPPRDERHRWISNAEVAEAESALDTRSMRGAGRYFDAATLDSRLVALLAVAAAERGVVVATRTSVERISGGPPALFTLDARDATGLPFRFRARTVVAATGAASDLARSEDPAPTASRSRLTSGTHIILPAFLRSHAVTLFAPSDGRVFFAIPFHGRTLVGTTDRDWVGDPRDPRPDPDDIPYLLESVNAGLARSPFTEADVITSFTGLRSLAQSGASRPSAASREQEVFEDPPGVVHVVGGKLTTFRAIARDMLQLAAQRLGRPLAPQIVSSGTPLPGAESPIPQPEVLASGIKVPPGALARLVDRYGCRAAGVIDLIRRDPWMGEPVAPSIPELRAELVWLARSEFARTATDALRRRLPRMLTDRVSASDLDVADQVMRRAL